MWRLYISPAPFIARVYCGGDGGAGADGGGGTENAS